MGQAASNAIANFQTYILYPSMKIVFALGMMLFVYGLVEFLWDLDNPGAKESGKQHMVWGIVGVLIMVSVWSIIAIVLGTFGIDYNTATDATRANVVPGLNY